MLCEKETETDPRAILNMPNLKFDSRVSNGFDKIQVA